MRSGRRGETKAGGGHRAGSQPASGVRRFTAVAVVLGVVAWAALPVLSFPLDGDTGSTTCRMACAGTPGCCCKPTADEPKHTRSSGTELSTPATRESCPRDCATLTVVPGTSTARSANGVHRLAAPGAAHTTHATETHAALHQGLFDVARPRGPPTEARNDRSIARASSDSASGFASLRSSESPETMRLGSGSSESRHFSAWHSIQQSVKRSHPAAKRSLTGVDAHHYGGNHE